MTDHNEEDNMTFNDDVVEIEENAFRDPQMSFADNFDQEKKAFEDATLKSGDFLEYDSDTGVPILDPKTNMLPDSGARRSFSTGSVRDVREGKGRFDLVSPFAVLSIAKRLEDGQQKYGERNWEKGQNLMSYLDSTFRHLYKFIAETMKGKEPTEDHISAATWNLHSFIHSQEMLKEGLLPPELDDLPTPERVGLKRYDSG